MHKFIQRKVYDTLSSKNGILTVFVSIVLLLSSAFYFGEAIVEWSSEKYAVVFNSFSDNLLGKSYRTRLCLPVPIDVVYTWVNGTDPQLLYELRKAKAELEEATKPNSSVQNTTNNSQQKCSYANCVKIAQAAFPKLLPAHIKRQSLELKSPLYKSLVRLEPIQSDDLRANFTLASFLSLEDANKATNHTLYIDGESYKPQQVYYTSDVTIPKSKLQQSVVLVSGFKKEYSSDEVLKLIPAHVSAHVFDVEMVGKVGIFTTSTSAEADTLLGFGFNFTLDGRYLQFNRANLVYDLTFSGGREMDLTASRFEDNEELRYSLRSLEQYAPWVRHIYIVTNGQIPYWLNLDNPRVTIVTHEEIFLNKSHLPTFSSPAIESHLHRIPGLSDKFLYLNDDVMFGAQVWPDDFYTHSKGQKVYLSWNIPDCAPGCPGSWIKDGYCDKACNVSECGWDAGDCDGGVPAFNSGNDWMNNRWNQDNEIDMVMCDPGCSNAWIADKYCDQACNTKSCGYDAGDCGVGNFHQLYSITMYKDVQSYSIPTGITEAYLNFSSVSTHKVSSASYEQRPTLRIAAVSNKYKVLTLVLLNKTNQTTFSVNMTFGEGHHKLELSFTVTTNSGATALSKPSNSSDVSLLQKAVPIAEEPPFIFSDIPEHIRGPKVLDRQVGVMQVQNIPLDRGVENLPADILKQLNDLQTQLDAGELTEKGFNMKRSKLLQFTPGGETIRKEKNLGQRKQNVNVAYQPIGGQASVKQQLIGGQASVQQQPIEGQANIQQQPKGLAVQQQPIGEQVNVQKPMGGQADIQQPIGQVNVQQPIGGQAKVQKPMGGQADIQQPIGQVDVQQPVGGQANVQQQPIGGQANVQQQQQPMGGQGNAQQQPIGGQANVQQQPIGGQANVQQQPIGGQANVQQQQQPMGGQGNAQQQPIGGQANVQQQPIGGQANVQQQQPIGGQANVQKPMGEQANVQKQMGKQANVQQQPIVGQANVQQQQPIVGQANVQQPIGGQANVQQQSIGGQANVQQPMGGKVNYTAGVHVGRQLQQLVIQDQELGFLPWENSAEFKHLIKKRDVGERKAEYVAVGPRNTRHLMDTFAQSLHHVNDLYNKMFGVKSRKVPGHISHMIDREVMEDLYNTFKEQWEITSSHKIRSGSDMQFAFSYFYFLMDSKRNNTAYDFIDDMDIDNSGVLSDRELRTMATRIFDSPLDLQSLTSLEQHIINCSKHLPVGKQTAPTSTYISLPPERYYDQNMPQVTVPLLKYCGPVLTLIKNKVAPKPKYRYEVMGDDDINFKMIRTNLSSVVGQLDDLRRHPKKFMCLNDNIDHSNSEAIQVKALLADFYESMFPIRSQFELPPDYRNRFLHIYELREWKKTRDYMKLFVEVLLVLLVLYTVYSYYEDQIKLSREKRRRPAGGESV